MTKILYILRGVPGSGKTALAKILAGHNGIICEADSYIYDDKGNYNWTDERVYVAHIKCFKLFESCIVDGVSTIVLSNTNTRVKDFKPYKELAEKNGYTVFVLVVENRHDNENVHNVDTEKLNKMEQRIKSNIKLK